MRRQGKIVMTESKIDWAAVGRRVAEARKRAGLVQNELADMVGRRNDAISRLERADTKSPPTDLIFSISQALSVSMEWLLLGEDVGSQDAPALSDEDLAIEGVRRDETRDGRELTDAESSYLRETFRATQLSIGAMSSEDAIRDLKIALRRLRAGQVEDYSRPSTPARDRLLGRKTRKRGK